MRVWLAWGLGLLIGLCSFTVGPTPAQAAWLEVAQTATGDRQWVAPRSLQVHPQFRQIDAYWLNAATGQITRYTSQYNCTSQQFRDVRINLQPGNLTWQDLPADPLNTATWNYVCGRQG